MTDITEIIASISCDLDALPIKFTLTPHHRNDWIKTAMDGHRYQYRYFLREENRRGKVLDTHALLTFCNDDLLFIDIADLDHTGRYRGTVRKPWSDARLVVRRLVCTICDARG